jgi:uncharacterized protein
MDKNIISRVKKHFPDIEAVYIFGSFGTEYERPDSDADIALLLPRRKKTDRSVWDLCRSSLEDSLSRTVDLIDLREVSTVFQNEIVSTGRRIFALDGPAFEFEYITLSDYQKLNEERSGILSDIKNTGRVLSL